MIDIAMFKFEVWIATYLMDVFTYPWIALGLYHIVLLCHVFSFYRFTIFLYIRNHVRLGNRWGLELFFRVTPQSPMMFSEQSLFSEGFPQKLLFPSFVLRAFTFLQDGFSDPKGFAKSQIGTEIE